MKRDKRWTGLLLALVLAACPASAALGDWSVEYEVVIESKGGDTGESIPRVSVSAAPTSDPAQGRGGRSF